MNDPLRVYKDGLLALAGLLAKLLKVMGHSDPTAKAKQVELYQKYKANLKLYAQSAKNRWPWQDLLLYLRNLEGELGSDFEVKETVRKKLIKDLSELMVPPAELPEFKEVAPPLRPRFSKAQKEVLRAAKQRVEAEQAAFSPPPPSPPTLRQTQGTASLLRLIQAINKVGPDAIEAQINKHYRKKE